MRKILLAFVLITGSLPSFANTVLMTLSEAIKVNMVEVSGAATGQNYRSRALRLKAVNKSGSIIQLKINQGAIFNPTEAGYQPLVCAGEEMITLQPFKDGQLDVQTFCADAPNKAPMQNLAYKYARAGSDTLVKLLQYVKKNFFFDDLGQDAVWVVTNNHGLETVYDGTREMQAEKLIDYLVQITGKPKPTYYLSNTVSLIPGQPVYVAKPLKIHAKFEQVLSESKKLTLGVFDGTGKMIQEVFSNRPYGKAGHRFTVNFESSNVPAGQYYIRLKEGETVLQEKMVEVK
ncbi:MAG: hypothetical protein EOP56_02975 [Sphingobacteriales bacterium]|nr:MAG: hypothetical protein EOP56_02975 [Sphingobacteriales bacterium]